MTYLAKEKVGSSNIILFNIYFVSFHRFNLFLLNHPVESWVRGNGKALTLGETQMCVLESKLVGV